MWSSYRVPLSMLAKFHVNAAKGATTERSGVRTPSTFSFTTILDETFNLGVSYIAHANVFLCFLRNVNHFKISLPTIDQIERFEVRNFEKLLGGAHKAPSSDPRSFSGFALNLGFARFGPPTFEARLRSWMQLCSENECCVQHTYGILNY